MQSFNFSMWWTLFEGLEGSLKNYFSDNAKKLWKNQPLNQIIIRLYVPYYRSHLFSINQSAKLLYSVQFETTKKKIFFTENAEIDDPD